MVFTGDMKQQTENSGFWSPLANRGCGKCLITKLQKADLTFNTLLNARYHHRVLQERRHAEALTQSSCCSWQHRHKELRSCCRSSTCCMCRRWRDIARGRCVDWVCRRHTNKLDSVINVDQLRYVLGTHDERSVGEDKTGSRPDRRTTCRWCIRCKSTRLTFYCLKTKFSQEEGTLQTLVDAQMNPEVPPGTRPLTYREKQNKNARLRKLPYHQSQRHLIWLARMRAWNRGTTYDTIWRKRLSLITNVENLGDTVIRVNPSTEL